MFGSLKLIALFSVMSLAGRFKLLFRLRHVIVLQCLVSKHLKIHYTLTVWRFKPFLIVGWRVHSYLSGSIRSRIIGRFGLEKISQKTKVVCSVGRTTYGGSRNV